MGIKVFVSYSHQDAAYLDERSLMGYLRGLRKEGVEFWFDEALVSGDKWDEEIKDKINQTDIALILVSQAFLNSDYCTNVEIKLFLRQCRERGLVIFPIILSACEWERHGWLKSRQFLPGGNETIEEHYTDPGRQKRLFNRILEDLRTQIDRIREEKVSREAAEQVSKELINLGFSGPLLEKLRSISLNPKRDDEEMLWLMRLEAEVDRERQDYLDEIIAIDRNSAKAAMELDDACRMKQRPNLSASESLRLEQRYEQIKKELERNDVDPKRDQLLQRHKALGLKRDFLLRLLRSVSGPIRKLPWEGK
jgi:hypothetical protein